MEDKYAYLTIWAMPDNKGITIQIRDDGEGYSKELTSLNPSLISASKNKHISFGLTIIRSYSERCEISKRGSILEIDFLLEPTETVAN